MTGDSDGFDIDHVRQRAVLWVGNTGASGRQHLLWELVSNSLDQFVEGHVSELSVALHADGSATVADDGPGIEVHGLAGESEDLERLFTSAWRSSAAHSRAFSSTFGKTWTVGLGAVGALCRRVDVEVCRGGTRFQQSFSRGMAISGLTQTATATLSGTTVRIEPDPDIFHSGAWIVEDVLARLHELSCLAPGLKVSFSQEPVTIGAGSDLTVLVKRLAKGLPGRGGGPIALLERRAEPSVARVALMWRQPYWRTKPESDFAPVVQLWCNFRHSPWVGPHCEGIGRGLREVFDVRPDDADHLARLLRGLVAVVDLRLPAPVWKGQYRNDLVSPEAADLVRAAIVEQLPLWLEQEPEFSNQMRSRSAPPADVKPWPVQRLYMR